jgi:heme-degrading monooxygenase HmoA
MQEYLHCRARVTAILPEIVIQTWECVMFSGMLEVNPNSDKFDTYFGMAKMLKPELEKIDGFIDNNRYASLTRQGWLLSLSTWRDEKSLVRWSVEANHHKVMQAARDRVFADYRMHIGEIVADTRVPQGQPLLQQRLDETEAGIGKAITLLDATYAPEWVTQAGADAVAKSLGFDPGTSGVVAWDVFEALTTPGEVIALVKWSDAATAEAFAQNATLPEGGRLRRMRIVRDYGMFDRREAPQYFAEAHAKA